MKRKEFLKKSIPAAMLPFFINGMRFQAYGATPMLKAMAEAAAKNGKVFVLIQLSGGNDGLNTIIPTDQYSNLSTVRSNILIPESKVLKLNGVTGTGMHPAMTALKDLYNAGKINIVQSVGYPNPNYSHFRATDIWHSASDSNAFVNSGWAGRYLQGLYTGFPVGYPNTDEPDPLAISIGYSVSTSLMGPTASTGMAISNPTTFYQLVSGTVDPAPNTPAGHELTYVRLVLQQTQAYNVTVKAAAQTVTNKATYPKSSLADQLKIVANLIAGGLKTPIYTVSLGGFDTHSSQVDASSTEAGSHADLWKQVSEAIAAFQSDCEQLGIHERVAGMTYSEFGRRIKSNDSRGTDHGAAAPLIVFGTNVNPGIIGSNPTIPSNVTVEDNIPMQYDFRQVYASILIDWFESPVSTTDSDLLFKHFDTLAIFKKDTSVNAPTLTARSISLMQNYPNPFRDLTTIDFMSPGGQVELRLYDKEGRLLQVLLDEVMDAGKHSYILNGSPLPAGNYYYQLITEAGQVGRHLVKL